MDKHWRLLPLWASHSAAVLQFFPVRRERRQRGWLPEPWRLLVCNHRTDLAAYQQQNSSHKLPPGSPNRQLWGLTRYYRAFAYMGGRRQGLVTLGHRAESPLAPGQAPAAAQAPCFGVVEVISKMAFPRRLPCLSHALLTPLPQGARGYQWCSGPSYCITRNVDSKWPTHRG